MVRGRLTLELGVVWYVWFICLIQGPWLSKLLFVVLIRRVCLVAICVHIASRRGHTSNVAICRPAASVAICRPAPSVAICRPAPSLAICRSAPSVDICRPAPSISILTSCSLVKYAPGQPCQVGLGSTLSIRHRSLNIRGPSPERPYHFLNIRGASPRHPHHFLNIRGPSPEHPCHFLVIGGPSKQYCRRGHASD